MASWTNLPQFQVTCATSISRMDQLLDNIIVSSSHLHTGVTGQGASVLDLYTLGASRFNTIAGANQSIFPFLPACAGGWWRISPCSSYPNCGVMNTDPPDPASASGASICYDIPIFGDSPTGAWRFRVSFRMNSNAGCVAACIGGSVMLIGTASTVSLYSATVASTITSYSNLLMSFASGIYPLRFQVVGKDVSSGGYRAGIAHIALISP